MALADLRSNDGRSQELDEQSRIDLLANKPDQLTERGVRYQLLTSHAVAIAIKAVGITAGYPN